MDKETKTFMFGKDTGTFGFSVSKERVISAVSPGSQAHIDGLLPGDTVECVNKIPISDASYDDWDTFIESFGDLIELTISRSPNQSDATTTMLADLNLTTGDTEMALKRQSSIPRSFSDAKVTNLGKLQLKVNRSKPKTKVFEINSINEPYLYQAYQAGRFNEYLFYVLHKYWRYIYENGMDSKERVEFNALQLFQIFLSQESPLSISDKHDELRFMHSVDSAASSESTMQIVLERLEAAGKHLVNIEKEFVNVSDDTKEAQEFFKQKFSVMPTDLTHYLEMSTLDQVQLSALLSCFKITPKADSIYKPSPSSDIPLLFMDESQTASIRQAQIANTNPKHVNSHKEPVLLANTKNATCQNCHKLIIEYVAPGVSCSSCGKNFHFSTCTSLRCKRGSSRVTRAATKSFYTVNTGKAKNFKQTASESGLAEINGYFSAESKKNYMNFMVKNYEKFYPKCNEKTLKKHHKFYFHVAEFAHLGSNFIRQTRVLEHGYFTYLRGMIASDNGLSSEINQLIGLLGDIIVQLLILIDQLFEIQKIPDSGAEQMPIDVATKFGRAFQSVFDVNVPENALFVSKIAQAFTTIEKLKVNDQFIKLIHDSTVSKSLSKMRSFPCFKFDFDATITEFNHIFPYFNRLMDALKPRTFKFFTESQVEEHMGNIFVIWSQSQEFFIRHLSIFKFKWVFMEFSDFECPKELNWMASSINKSLLHNDTYGVFSTIIIDDSKEIPMELFVTKRTMMMFKKSTSSSGPKYEFREYTFGTKDNVVDVHPIFPIKKTLLRDVIKEPSWIYLAVTGTKSPYLMKLNFKTKSALMEFRTIFDNVKKFENDALVDEVLGELSKPCLENHLFEVKQQDAHNFQLLLNGLTQDDLKEVEARKNKMNLLSNYQSSKIRMLNAYLAERLEDKRKLSKSTFYLDKKSNKARHKSKSSANIPDLS